MSRVSSQETTEEPRGDGIILDQSESLCGHCVRMIQCTSRARNCASVGRKTAAERIIVAGRKQNDSLILLLQISRTMPEG